MTSLTKGSCMMYHHTVHSESFDSLWEERFLEVSHSNCLCHWVVKGHLSPLLKWGLLTVRLGWDIKRWSVLWDELGLIALLLFSAGSRTTFTQTEKEKNKTKKKKNASLQQAGFSGGQALASSSSGMRGGMCPIHPLYAEPHASPVQSTGLLTPLLLQLNTELPKPHS